MSLSAIRLFPDPVLRQKALPVTDFSRLGGFLRHMEEILWRQPSGIGIAAPQVGLSRRIAIVDVRSRVPGAERLILINPVILEAREERASREGCMSLPDYTATLKRSNRVRVRWTDEGGRLREKETSGIEAVCIQHEVDHLDGVLFLDRVASLKRDMIPRPRDSRKPKG